MSMYNLQWLISAFMFKNNLNRSISIFELSNCTALTHFCVSHHTYVCLNGVGCIVRIGRVWNSNIHTATYWNSVASQRVCSRHHLKNFARLGRFQTIFDTYRSLIYLQSEIEGCLLRTKWICDHLCGKFDKML